jgi:FAD/FMN-containing dehydrogenase/ferredoxin
MLASAEAEPLAGKAEDLIQGGSSAAASPAMRTLAKVVPASRLILGGEELGLYGRDQADVPPLLRRLLLRTRPDVVVQAADAAEGAAAVRFAVAHGMPVVPRGAASFPLGGCVPLTGGLVLDLTAMRAVHRVDVQALTVECDAGVSWAKLNELLKGFGLVTCTYPTSWFSTVGGWVATGGYGIHSTKFGHLRTLVDALQVVTPAGEVRWVRRGDGDFSLYFGTEGQFGLITRVVLRVRRLPKEGRQFLLHFPTVGDALTFARDLLAKGLDVSHMFYYDPGRMETFNRLAPSPLVKEAHSLLVVVEGREAMDRVEAALDEVRADAAPWFHASYLWQERFFPLKAKRLGPGLLGGELLAPLDRVEAIVAAWGSLASRAGLRLEYEAHVLSAKEVLLLGTFLTDPRNEALYALHSVLAVALMEVGIRLGGKPYGTGIWMSPFLEDRFGKAYARRLRREKRRRDPRDLLNPGKFFRVRSRLFNVLGLALSPGLAKLGIRATAPFLPILIRGVHGRSSRPTAPSNVLLEAAHECSSCGACVPMCPAYLASGSELISARGKLQVAAKLLRGEPVSPEDAKAMHLCIHCGYCEKVCQSQLPLLECWDDLERLVAAQHGVDADRVAAFSQRVQDDEEYRLLLGSGMVPETFYTYRPEGSEPRKAMLP